MVRNMMSFALLVLMCASTGFVGQEAVWHHAFDGGYVWITALGHHKKDYEDTTFMQHLLNGIRFIASQARKPDYSRAYATAKDEPVRNNIK